VNDYLENRPNLCLVFALIESGLAPQEIDLEFVEWLVRHTVPFVFVFTKTDKVSAAARRRILLPLPIAFRRGSKSCRRFHLFRSDSAGPAGVARGNRRRDDSNKHLGKPGRGASRKLTNPSLEARSRENRKRRPDLNRPW